MRKSGAGKACLTSQMTPCNLCYILCWFLFPYVASLERSRVKWINCLKELNNKLIWQDQLKLLLLLKNILAKIYFDVNTPWRICLAENRTLIVNGLLAQRPRNQRNLEKKILQTSGSYLYVVSRSEGRYIFQTACHLLSLSLSLSLFFLGFFVWLHYIYRFETNWLNVVFLATKMLCLYIYFTIFCIVQHIWFILICYIYPYILLYNI